MDSGQDSSKGALLFMPHQEYQFEQHYEDSEHDNGAQLHKRSRSVRYPFKLSKWRELRTPGMVKLLQKVKVLWWIPVLYDEDLYDFHRFCTRARIHPASPKARLQHRIAVKALNEQKPLLKAKEPHQSLLEAFDAMKDLESLTVQPAREANRSFKSEKLNIFALASVLTALGHARVSDGSADLNINSRRRNRGVKRRQIDRASLTTLRIFGVDLCSLIALAPPLRILNTSGTDLDWLLPATLQDENDLNKLARLVFSELSILHWAFSRAEDFEPRLGMQREATGEAYDDQAKRISSILAACKQLRILRLAFHLPEVHDGQTTDQSLLESNIITSDNVDGDVLPPIRDNINDVQPMTTSGGLDPVPQFIPAPVELDLGLILPSRGTTLRPTATFQYLREFVLSTIVLNDSTPLYNFIKNHVQLEELGLEDVGIRSGPTWSALLAMAKRTLPSLRAVSTIRLMHVDSNSGYLMHESEQFYRLLYMALGSSVAFRYCY